MLHLARSQVKVWFFSELRVRFSYNQVMHTKLTDKQSIRLAIGAATTSFLVLMTALCMLLRPEMFDHPHWGLSFFGSQRITLLPYYGGFLVVIGSLAWITRILWNVQGKWRPFRYIFCVATINTTLVALTSSMQGNLLYWSHIYLAFALMLVVLVADIWTLCMPGRSWRDYGSFAIVLAGITLVVLSSDWLNILGIYYWGEVVLFVGAFMSLGSAALRAASDNS